jgi:hypothetical protein
MKPDTTKPVPESTVPKPTVPESAGTGDAYQAPSVTRVGDFAADTHGSVSVGNSDDSDAGQYYAP